MIDKLLHIYWGGQPLPWIRWLTIKSFRQFNPDYKIWLWMPKAACSNITWKTGELDYPNTDKDYLQLLKENVDEVKLLDIPFLNNAHDSQRSDYLVYYALYNYGGIYADIDILFIKPLIYPDNFDLYITYFNNYYSCAGFLIAKKNNKIMKHLLRMSNIRFQSSSRNKYEKLGASFWKQEFPTPESIPHNYYHLPKNYLFPFTFMEMNKIFRENHIIPNETVGMHWFAGIAYPWINEYTEDNYKTFDSTFSKLCREYNI